MQQRLAAAARDHRGAEVRQLVHPALERLDGDRLGDLVVFVAVAAGDVAAPDRHDVHEQRVVGVDEAAHELARGARVARGLPKYVHGLSGSNSTYHPPDTARKAGKRSRQAMNGRLGRLNWRRARNVP